MTREAFDESLGTGRPPEGMGNVLTALWFDGAGDWERAHQLAQDIQSRDGSRLHAYLHRKEGDIGNAGYWYRRAEESMPSESLDEEWSHLVDRYLGTK